MNSFDAIIFDADGTLVDSEDIGLELLFEHARCCGVQFERKGEVDLLRGRSMASCLTHLELRLGRTLPSDFEERLRQSMAEAFADRLQPMPGALHLLQALRVPYCVATNGPRSKVELTMRVTGLLPLVGDRIFCAPEVGSFKPDPGLFLTAAAALGVSPERCAVVEDSEPGMLAGLRAGMHVFAIQSQRPLPRAMAGRVHMLQRLQDLLECQGNDRRSDAPLGDCSWIQDRSA